MSADRPGKIKVRLKDTAHPHKNASADWKKLWEAWRGKMLVVGRAQKPTTEWGCGTKRIYPVFGPRRVIRESAKISGSPLDMQVYICDCVIEKAGKL